MLIDGYEMMMMMVYVRCVRAVAYTANRKHQSSSIQPDKKKKRVVNSEERACGTMQNEKKTTNTTQNHVPPFYPTRPTTLLYHPTPSPVPIQ
jgi:hypothetical protein